MSWYLDLVVTDTQELQVLRTSVDDAIRNGDHAAARERLALLWRRHCGPSVAAFVNSRLTKLPTTGARRTAVVAILRSFTVEPIIPLVRAAAGLNGLDLTIHLGDFNTYTQELLDPASQVYTEWAPDVVILAVQTRDIVPELWSSFADWDAAEIDRAVERTLGEYEAMIDAFRRSSSASLVIHGLELPPHPALGAADRANPNGQHGSIERINAGLRETAALTPGVHVLDTDGMISRAGRQQWYDADKWASMRMPIHARHLGDIAAEWVRHIQPLVGQVVKALVVDLDNTLWGGVLGEDLIAGVALSAEGPGSGFWHLQRAIRDLTARGILLGICSKNNESDVREMFDQHDEMVLHWSDFAAVRINWDDKLTNLRSIASELNIGLDAIAFLDDNPAECALIQREAPEVVVIHLDRPPDSEDHVITGNPFFERLSLTTEDRARVEQYAQRNERRAAEGQSASLEGYLRSLATTVEVRAVASGDLVRVAQLTQKTNQFNLTTQRYTEAEIAQFVSDDQYRVLLARSADRFGDHGTVGVVIVRVADDVWEIDTMLLSCRVIGRGVETAILASVADDAHRYGATALLGRFIATNKNAPAADFFSNHGFVPASAGLGAAPTGDHPVADTSWIRSLSTPLESPDWITTIDYRETAHD